MLSPSSTAVVLILAAAGVALGVWITIPALLGILRRRDILDRPNERSSHELATPKGGGLIVVPAILVAWVALVWWFGQAPPGFVWVLAGAVGLTILSWLDDLKDLPAIARLLAQGLAVGAGLWGMGEDFTLFGGIVPLWLDRAVALLVWVWFVNLFNFMDGIDGITGVESCSIGLGLVAVALLLGWGFAMIALPLLVCAAVLGFLFWNWAPARLFLGDVGSVPLGFLLGWLLLLVVDLGQWPVAVILPLYYLADSSLTLAKRLFRGEKIWRAHREHFYQRAVQRGLSHASVCVRVLFCNVLLIFLAVLSVLGAGFWVLPAAVVIVVFLLFSFRGPVGILGLK